MSTKKSTFILDVIKWRCGNNSKKSSNRLGKGETYLLNKEGYMCCLGQFAKQLGQKDEDIFDLGDPLDMNFEDKTSDLKNSILTNIEFTGEAININDNTTTTIKDKIEQLRILLKGYGHKLRVIGLKNLLNTKEVSK